MDFVKVPFDSHDCPFNIYISSEDKEAVVLNKIPDAEPKTNKSEDTFYVEQNILKRRIYRSSISGEKSNIYFDYSDSFHSGIKYIIHLQREIEFFFIYYFIPSLLVVFLTYAGFWIDKAAIPARVSIGITPISITVNLVSGATLVYGSSSELSWQIQFMVGIILFTAFGMIEYGILNF